MIKNIVIILLIVMLVISLRKQVLFYGKKIARLVFRIAHLSHLNNPLDKINGRESVKQTIYPVLTSNQEIRLKNAIRLTFTGDLILLKDMVENGFDHTINKYNFSSMFKYVKAYYDDSDYNIGVFEGPVAGAERGYSTSCFNDGIPLYLNFPKEYAQAVKVVGFDMVSLANNHLLDQGIEGVYHTLGVLDEIGLSHVGAYRNAEEKEPVKIVEVCGKKIAILAYTYGSNYCKTDFFFQSENHHLTRIIVSPQSKYIKQVLVDVKSDFEQAKSLSPDLIIVMPHMGKQFMHKPDDFQKYWCKVFVEYGADVILSDHPHAVQPIEWINNEDKNVLIVHCPGNYINSYIEHDGDASMIVECYLDPDTGKPFASACIPIYAYCKYGRDSVENYTGIPIYELIKNKNICPELSRYEFNRIQTVQKLITKTALGVELGIDNLHKRYYTFADLGYVCQSNED